jgi:uncharacterized repeat protein (TIGR04076 family)
MPERYKIKVTIDSETRGSCPEGFKVGDSWIIDADKTPNGMCALAYNALFPVIRAFRWGGESRGDNKDVTYLQCPDSKRGLLYEIRKVR